MIEAETRQTRFARHTGGWVLGGTFAGYCLLPALRYAEPWTVGLGGLLMGWGIIALYEQAVTVEDPKKRHIAPAFLPIAVGAMFLFIGVGGALFSGFHAERACYKIQQELIDGTPAEVKRGRDLPNAADRFQALGCHYQSSRPYSPLMIFEDSKPAPAAPR